VGHPLQLHCCVPDFSRLGPVCVWILPFAIFPVPFVLLPLPLFLPLLIPLSSHHNLGAAVINLPPPRFQQQRDSEVSQLKDPAIRSVRRRFQQSGSRRSCTL
jgi:hypothetical protein